MKEAQLANEDLLGALDYEEMFDQFQPDLAKGLLDDAGLPQGHTNQLQYLRTDLGTVCQN